MSDDIMANVYDKDGNKRKLVLEEMLSLYASVLRSIYIDIMVTYPTLTHSMFKKGHIDFVSSIVDAYDDNYADHIEGIRKQVLDKMAEDD